MEHILIAKNVAYAAKTGGGTAANPSELAPGALGVFTRTGVLITAANLAATTPDLKDFFIAVGAGGSVNRTPAIQREGVYDFRAAEYAPVVRAVTTITLTNLVFVNADSSTVTTATYAHANRGDEAIVRIVDTTTGEIKPNIQSYSVPVKAGDTATTLATKLVSAINIDGDKIVTATSAAAVITLTSNVDGGNFRVSLDGVAYQGGTVAYTTPADPGTGTSMQIASKERLSQASTNNVMEQAGGRGALPVVLFTVDGETYDQYFIDPVNRHHAKDGQDATYGRYIPITVCFPDAATSAEAVFEGLMAGLIGYKGATSPEPATDTVSAG